jgi:dCMP deaminase
MQSSKNFNTKWQRYFLSIAETVAKGSSCFSRKVGAVLVTDEKQIIATGYNGPPRGVTHCGPDRVVKDAIFCRFVFNEPLLKNKECPRRILGFSSGQGLEYCIAAHAERNALIQAARHGIATNNSTLFLTCGIPCKDCLIEIINAGVKEVFVTDDEYYDEASAYLVEESKILITPYFV